MAPSRLIKHGDITFSLSKDGDITALQLCLTGDK